MSILVTRNSAVLAKIEASDGTFEAPNPDTDGVLVEMPSITMNSQNTDTNEVSGSLDSDTPIIGGTQCEISFTAYLKGSGTAGVAPEYGDLLRACSMSETITKTDLTGSDISFVNSTGKILAAATDISALTVGTGFSVIDSTDNDGEYLVTAAGAGEITVTKTDGTSADLTDESAGASIILRYGIAAATATAGSKTGFTADAPFAATADLYRGMPVLLSTNPVTPEFTFMNEYSVARVAEIVKTMGAALDNTTVVSIPANVVYVQASAAIPSVSLEVYRDGLLYRFTGCRGSVKFSYDAGGATKADFSISGLFVSKTDAAVPSITYDDVRPGSFRNSPFLINRLQAGISNLSIDLANNLVFPPDSGGSEGFVSPKITGRHVTGSVDPNETLVATRDIMTTFRAGGVQIIHATVKGGSAANVGQRISQMIPEAFYTKDDPSDRDGIATEDVEFFCKGKDSGAYLCFF